MIEPVASLGEQEVARWQRLEFQSLEPNIYLTWDFVSRLDAHGVVDHEIALLAVEATIGGRREYIAVLPVTRAASTRSVPLPHLRGLSSKYSFLGGMLLHRDHAEAAAQALFRHLWERRWRLAGLRLQNLVAESKQAGVLREAAQDAGFVWQETGRSRRACLKDVDDPAKDHLGAISRKRLKEWRRLRRKLEAEGDVSWSLRRGLDIDEAAVERFLVLEDAGWKGGNGSSLLTDPASAGFFRDLVERLRARNRVFFTELRLGERVIASTVNFQMADEGFAFKIGWDPDYARHSIGVLNELAFLERLPAAEEWGLKRMDSGSEEGAFIDALWRDGVTLTNGAFTANPLLKVMTRALAYVRRIGRRRPGTRRRDGD